MARDSLVFTITSVACTASEALSAFLRPPARNTHLSVPISRKNAPDDSGATAWLCTDIPGRDFSR